MRLRPLVSSFALVFAAASLVACSKSSSANGAVADAGATGASVKAATTAAEDEESVGGRLFPSRRCGECHGRQHDEWRRSAHARSNQEVFHATLAHVPEASRAGCTGCHVPLEQAGARIARDGVGCDACHTASGPGQAGHGLTLAPELATRFGPYRDSADHHFHRADYSEFVVSDALCASCHQDPAGATVPAYTTVAELRASPEPIACNACHMPPLRDVAAKGEKIRTVSRHDFHPDKAAALKEALEVAFTVEPGRGAATVALTNNGAGHHLPTGRPERRLLLEVSFEDESGQTLRTERRSYGRRLVDADGALAPSFLAAREDGDERLVSGQTRTERFDIPKGADAAVVRLLYLRFDEALAHVFGSPEPLLVLERREDL